jgi:pyruvate/2-oxoglutarate dehydrogenase complex dihydrolipoamide acyltransferase (E2) component
MRLAQRPIGGTDSVAKVTMPQLGESVAEGTIGRWLKQPGDTVEKYEPLLEVITDKVNAEVPSPFAGVLKEILVQEGDTVPNNAEIAVIETADDGAGQAEAAATGDGAGAVATDTATMVEPPAGAAHGPAGSDERPAPAPASVAAAATPSPS